VLDISRIESGRLTLSLEPVALNTILEETVSLMRPVAADRRITVAASTGVRGHVIADQHRLRQVMLNLLSNAVKYNREAGRVEVSCEVVAGHRVRINVTDTGPGIAAEKMARLFVPFDRLGAEHSATEGTGIGLALSRGLIQLMGGEMGAESVVGRGSTFWVTLRMAEDPLSTVEPVAPAPPVAALAPARPSRTVLYVEDNLSNLQLLQRILATRPGVRLLEAMQGRMGLDLAREHQPDLILLDLHLPDVSGEEVLARLRAEAETAHIPVVVISADAMRDRAVRLIASGARAYVTKPLDVRAFLAILDDVLGTDG
jgi:CheY-like chemotaxis protein